MAYRPIFELSSFDHLPHAWKRGILGKLVEVNAFANMAMLHEFPGIPHLYASGVRYVFNYDRFQDIPSCLERGEADCKDLTAWLLAFYWKKGHPAAVHVQTKETDGLTIYHVQVRHPSGAIEDPSVALGMGKDGVAPILRGRRAAPPCARRAVPRMPPLPSPAVLGRLLRIPFPPRAAA